MNKSQLNQLASKLKGRLGKPLPGWESQKKMANIPRARENERFITNDKTRTGGVLVLFYPCKEHICLAFMKRTEYEGVHSGQISFPGGGMEASDGDVIFTALREAHEELAIDPGRVDVVGQLSELFIPPSNYLVHPIVGVSFTKPDFIAEPEEVAEIIEMRLEDLLDDSHLMHKTINIGASLKLRVPCYSIGNTVIWGATAMILTELLDIIREL